MRLHLPGIVVAIVLLPMVHGGESAPSAPASVSAIVMDGRVHVTWTDALGVDPTSVSYVIYGSHGKGGRGSPLDSALGFERSAEVPLGFKFYGVAAVADGVQSSTTWMSDCLVIHSDAQPPEVFLADDCAGDDAAAKVPSL